MTRTLDCTNLVNLLASMGLELESEIASVQGMHIELYGEAITRRQATQFYFDTMMLKSYAKTGRVPIFCREDCEHSSCRHNGLVSGDVV